MVEALFLSPRDVNAFGKMDIKDIDAEMAPLGMAYIVSYIRKKGHSVKLIDLKDPKISWKEDIIPYIKKEKPRFVGMTCYTPSINDVLRICRLIKDIDKNIKTVLGGAHPSAAPEATIKNKEVDFVVYGEGEETFLEMLEQRDLSKIKGIYYKNKGKITRNPPRELIKNLDSLPWPAYDMLPIKIYGNPFLGESMIFATGRGCPFRCIFCSSGVMYKHTYRVRSVKDVVDELAYLHRKHKIKNFIFVDDTFTAIPKRTEEMCKEIIRRKLKISWMCDTRVNTVSEKLFRIMKKAGCRIVKFGIESGDQKILDSINKNIRLEEVHNAVKMAKKVGLQTHAFFILGLPYDTEETMNKTIELSKKLPLDFVQFSILTPYPGTKTFEMAEKGEGIRLLSDDWGNFMRYGEPIVELPTVSAKRLEQLHARAYREFYFRPKYMLNRLLHTQMSEWLKLFPKAFSLLNFIKKSGA